MSDIVERISEVLEITETYGSNPVLSDARDEIERLRADLFTARCEAEDMSGEIERLRGDADQLHIVVKEQAQEVQRLRAEIEPLRIALGLLTTIKPTMEIDVTDPVGMAQQIAAHVADEIERLRDAAVIARTTEANLHSEIERLRGLLREAHLALSFMPDPTRKLLDLRYRVRETLGE